MYKNYWDLAKDFGEIILDFAEMQYHLRLYKYYEEALERGGRNNIDVCHLPRFILSSRVEKHAAYCKEQDVHIKRGECVRDLEEINKIIKALPPDGTRPKINTILDFDTALHAFVYNYAVPNDNGKVSRNIPVKNAENLHDSDVSTIKRFRKEISKMNSSDYPLDLIELVKKLRK